MPSKTEEEKKTCERECKKKYREKNREKIAERARWLYQLNPELNRIRRERNRFLIALKKSREMAKRQGGLPCLGTASEIAASFTGRCQNPACGKQESECTKRLALDHCHATGRFRGWLCNGCNAALGYTRDNPEVIRMLIAYLQKSTAGQPDLAASQKPLVNSLTEPV
jgi:hypothetical protein